MIFSFTPNPTPKLPEAWTVKSRRNVRCEDLEFTRVKTDFPRSQS